MKVLFLKDVPGVALGGEVKEVKNGYARNYLIPYNIAVLANNESLKQVEKIKVVAEKERVAKMEDLKKVFESMQNLTINIPMLSAQTGKLYGSVGHDMISGALKESKGIEVEERYIKLSESIKEHGIYNVLIEISEEMSTNLKIVVHDPEQDPNELAEAPVEAEAEAPVEAEAEAPVEAEAEAPVEAEAEAPVEAEAEA
ncbi:MAG: 50S ribosomal protein L9, partial [Dehalococcoidia bacterium]